MVQLHSPVEVGFLSLNHHARDGVHPQPAMERPPVLIRPHLDRRQADSLKGSTGRRSFVNTEFVPQIASVSLENRSNTEPSLQCMVSERLTAPFLPVKLKNSSGP